MLLIGDTSLVLEHLPFRFLLIDDGSLIDKLPSKIRRFNPRRHSFNVLTQMTKKKARDLSTIFYSRSPQGENTLTVRNGKRTLARLLYSAKRLDKLPRTKDDDNLEANGIVDDVLFSDILSHVLLRATNFPFTGTILARLNRAELGDEDCYILANLLIGQYKGVVVIPDFGFYQAPFHKQLIRQRRLIAGVRTLSEIPDFKDILLLGEKHARHCLYDDAEVLAKYEGLRPDKDHADNPYDNFIRKVME